MSALTTSDVMVIVVAMVVAGAMAGAMAWVVAVRQWQKKSDSEETRYEVQAKLIRQLQEQLESQQRTITFMSNRVTELEVGHASEFVETEALRKEIEELRREVREQGQGLDILSEQLRTAGITPGWAPRAKRASAEEWATADPVALWEQIVKGFTIAEIEELAVLLDVEPDDLKGGTKRSKAQALVTHMEDRDRLKELGELVRSKRPGGRKP